MLALCFHSKTPFVLNRDRFWQLKSSLMWRISGKSSAIWKRTQSLVTAWKESSALNLLLQSKTLSQQKTKFLLSDYNLIFQHWETTHFLDYFANQLNDLQEHKPTIYSRELIPRYMKLALWLTISKTVFKNLMNFWKWFTNGIFAALITLKLMLLAAGSSGSWKVGVCLFISTQSWYPFSGKRTCWNHCWLFIFPQIVPVKWFAQMLFCIPIRVSCGITPIR